MAEKSDERRERLAAQLRANLKRRKAPARKAEEAQEPEPTESEDNASQINDLPR